MSDIDYRACTDETLRHLAGHAREQAVRLGAQAEIVRRERLGTHDGLLLAIARKHCSASIETLETRLSDRLDFYDVGVSGLRDALRAAFDAGRSAECASWVERIERPTATSPDWQQRSRAALAAYRAVAGDEAGSFEERMLDEARMPAQVARVAYQSQRTAAFWDWLTAEYLGVTAEFLGGAEFLDASKPSTPDAVDRYIAFRDKDRP
jgi:hypothetical protein